jgi:hypothetical protein
MPAKSKTRKPNYRKKNYMREHYVRQGLTCAEIGELNGVSAVTIHNWLGKLNIPIRSRGSRHPLNPKWNTDSDTPETTITVRRCTSCGKSGHNSRTCGKDSEVIAEPVLKIEEPTFKIQEKPSNQVKVIKNETNVDPAVQHLRSVRDKLLADLSNVEQALSLIENL